AKLADVGSVRRIGIILPAVDVGNEQDSPTSITNRLYGFAQLVAIPEIALFVELDKTQPINVFHCAAPGGRDCCFGRCFPQMVRLIRGAASKKKGEATTDNPN